MAKSIIESDLPAAFMGKCYCLDCSNESGTGHITTVAVPDAGLKVTGTLSEYTKRSDDGFRPDQVLLHELRIHALHASGKAERACRD